MRRTLSSVIGTARRRSLNIRFDVYICNQNINVTQLVPAKSDERGWGRDTCLDGYEEEEDSEAEDSPGTEEEDGVSGAADWGDSSQRKHAEHTSIKQSLAIIGTQIDELRKSEEHGY